MLSITPLVRASDPWHVFHAHPYRILLPPCPSPRRAPSITISRRCNITYASDGDLGLSSDANTYILSHPYRILLPPCPSPRRAPSITISRRCNITYASDGDLGLSSDANTYILSHP